MTSAATHPQPLGAPPRPRYWAALSVLCAVCCWLLVGCASPQRQAPAPELIPAPPSPTTLPTTSLSGVNWLPVDFAQLPGWPEANLGEAWSALIASCKRPPREWVALCPALRTLSLGSEADKQAWIETQLQAYQLASADGKTEGLLTAYFEPEMAATRLPTAGSNVPLYRPPVGLSNKAPWFTRREIDTLPEAQAALQGRELAYLTDPVDALILHIQGSGKAKIQEPDGRVTYARIAFAATNEQPYKSVARWLLDQGQLRDTSWPAIRNWAQRNPGLVNEMLWSNPRYVFFKEEPLNGLDAAFGPKGAQGVPLTAGRSIAVDPSSVPYGAPVWIHTQSPTLSTSRLVVAQDTGSAIVGAVRADYYAGSGAAAGDLAGRVKQGYKAWVLWPKGASLPARR